jgi:queuine tRNA-ribosyltransferase
MPVGTVGTVKGVHQRELEDVNQILFWQTPTIVLRPGMEVLET